MQASTAGFALTWIFVGLVGAWGTFAAGALLDRTSTLGSLPVECALLPARNDIIENNLRIRNRNLSALSVLLIANDPPHLDSSAPSTLVKVGPGAVRDVFLDLFSTELVGTVGQDVELGLEADVTTVDANGVVLSYQVTCSSSQAADLAG